MTGAVKAATTFTDEREGTHRGKGLLGGGTSEMPGPWGQMSTRGHCAKVGLQVEASQGQSAWQKGHVRDVSTTPSATVSTPSNTSNQDEPLQEAMQNSQGKNRR